MSSRFLSLYGKSFFSTNFIPKQPSSSLGSFILRNGMRTTESVSSLRSSLFPFVSAPRAKSTGSVKKFVDFKPPPVQIKQFSSTGHLKFIRISNFKYNENYKALRIGLLFTVIFVAGTTLSIPYLFQYTPLRYFQKHPTHLVYALVGLNCAVFAMWQLPRILPWISRYGLLEKSYGFKPVTMLTSAFSHQEIWHLGVNMLALYSFGTSLAVMIGASNFLTLYLNSAVLASLASLVYPVLMRIPLTAPSLGASGALFAVFGTFAYLIPKAQILLFVFPIPGGAWVAFLGSIAWNMAGCVMRWGSFDYAAHLGGSLAGIFYGWLITERIEKEREREAQRLRSLGFW